MRFLPVLVPAGAYLALHLMGWRYPAALWGVDQLSYYPAGFGAFFVILGGLALGVAARERWAVRVDGEVGRLVQRLAHPRLAGLWFKVLLLALFLAVSYTLRVRAHHLGDSSMWFRNLELSLDESGRGQIGWIRGLPIAGFEHLPAFEVLDFVLHLEAYRLGRWLFGWEPSDAYAWLSCLAGVCYAVVLWKLAALLGRSALQRVTLFALFFTLGSLQLFFGYGESYTLVSLAGALYALLALRALEGGSLVGPALCLLLAVALHMMALCLLPSLLYLVWRRNGRPLAAWLGRPRVRVLLLGVGGLLGLFVYARYYPHRLALWQPAEAGQYALLSADHFLQLLDEVLLLSPFGLLWGLGCLGGRKDLGAGWAFAGWAALGAGLLAGLHDAYLGGRDWDLRAFPGLFYTLWGVQCLLARRDAEVLLRQVRLAVVPLMVLHTGAWLGINADATRATARLGNLLQRTNQAAHYRAYALGYYYSAIAQKDFGAAVGYFRQAIDLAPPDSLDPQGLFRARYRKHLAQALFRDRRYGEAVGEFGRIYGPQPARLDDNDRIFYRSWITALLEAGEDCQEAGLGERADSLRQEALRRCQQVVGWGKDAEFLYLQGKTHLALEEYDRAIAALRQALEEEEEEERRYLAYTNLALALEMKGGDPGETIAALHEAVRIRPGEPRLYSTLGNLYERQGELGQALQYYRQALRLRGDDVETLRKVGATLAGMNEFPEAVEAYRQALRLRPEDPSLHYALALAQIGLGRTEEGIRGLQEAIRLDEGYGSAYLKLGQLYQQAGRQEAALEMYLGGLEKGSASAAGAFFAQLGLELFRLGDLPNSTRAYRRALEMEAEDATARTNLGWNLYLNGDLDGAIAAFQQVLEKHPNPVAQFNLGLVYLARGEVDAARAVYAQGVARYGAAAAMESGAVTDLRELAARGIQERAAREMLARYWGE